MWNLNWIEKLKIECIDEEDGTMTIHIEWDEKDPDLDYWTSLGPKSQEEFILTALREACAAYTDTESSDDHVD
jgi:hypothetical protein